MTISISPRLESSLRLGCGALLWIVSATLTMVLLMNLGDGSILGKALLGAVAVSLEGAKILSWRKGGRARVFAFALIALSGIASIGASLSVVEKTKGASFSISLEDLRASPAYLEKASEIRSIDQEIGALIDRMKSLPPDFTTASGKLTESLSSLRDRKESNLASIAKMETSIGASPTSSNMIALLGRSIGIPTNAVLLFLLLFVAGAIEAGALLLTAPDSGDVPHQNRVIARFSEEEAGKLTDSAKSLDRSPSYTPLIDAEAFLEAAKEGADLPFLHGRDRTAEILGISCADGKRLVSKLIEDGRVVVEGKRLRLLSVEARVAESIQT
jgi:hypothetical protein